MSDQIISGNGEAVNQLRYAKAIFALAFDPRLNDRAKTTAIALQKYAFDKADCYPSNESLSKDVGCSRSVVQRALHSLERVGWISTKSLGKEPWRLIILNWRLDGFRLDGWNEDKLSWDVYKRSGVKSDLGGGVKSDTLIRSKSEIDKEEDLRVGKLREEEDKGYPHSRDDRIRSNKNKCSGVNGCGCEEHLRLDRLKEREQDWLEEPGEMS